LELCPRPQPNEPDLAAKLEFLRRPDAYPDHVERVDAIETHMAWVFLAGERAYKLKKPVRYPFLDYTSLEARRFICSEEIRLNRRLAPDVYLDVVPLTQDRDGVLALGGEGVAVEWLVAMRRLDPELLLDHAVRAGTASTDKVRPAAELLATFFADSRPARVAPHVYGRELRRLVLYNVHELTEHVRGSDAAKVEEVSSALLTFLKEQSELFRSRAREGRIKEGHGDLRPEHVFLGSPPAVIDCIEFSRRFRVQDPADELAFLAVELELLGAAPLGMEFLRAYTERTGDAPPASLFDFHAAVRAFVRAKLAIGHLADGADPKTWTVRCRTYLELSAQHAQRLPRCTSSEPVSAHGT
jgi:aminoglycoside phosphotransferase family enzyme